MTSRSRPSHLSLAAPWSDPGLVHVFDIADLPAAQASIIDTLTRIRSASLDQLTIPTATDSIKDMALALAALAENGLVRVWRHPVDQRTLLVELTTEGRSHLGEQPHASEDRPLWVC